MSLFISFLLGGNVLWNRNELYRQIKTKKGEIDFFISKWSVTPEEYRTKTEEWKKRRLACERIDEKNYGFIPLRMNPLIEVKKDIFLCPIAAFLIEKVIDEPFFSIVDFINSKTISREEKKREREEFFHALGFAFEEYTNALVKKIAVNDKSGKWKLNKHPSSDRSRNEFADCYLRKGNIGVCFEYKGSRLNKDFLSGDKKGDDQVLGPPDGILQKLDNGEELDHKKIKEKDKGFLTRAMIQQTMNAKNLREWDTKQNGTYPKRIFPIICYLAHVFVDEVIRKEYMSPLIKKSRLYNHDFLEYPQWVDIRSIEFLAAASETGSLSLAALLVEKNKPENKDTRFDVFLHKKGLDDIESRLRDTINLLMINAGSSFFGKDLSSLIRDIP